LLAGAVLAPAAGYWAVLEGGHSSRVKAGKNAGETLKHTMSSRCTSPSRPGSHAMRPKA